MAELTPLLGLGGDPEFIHIDRHNRALPLYHGDHLQRIARINSRLQQTPTAFEEALKGPDADFLRVRVSGTYDHGKALYFYALKKGELGWRVLTPLQPENGQDLV